MLRAFFVAHIMQSSIELGDASSNFPIVLVNILALFDKYIYNLFDTLNLYERTRHIFAINTQMVTANTLRLS